MNHKAMLELADRLEGEMPRVNMNVTAERWECGTVGCIAGWFAEWYGERVGFKPTISILGYEKMNKQPGEYGLVGALDVARVGLDLNDSQVQELCYLRGWPDDLQDKYDREWRQAERVRTMSERIRRMVRDDIAKASV